MPIILYLDYPIRQNNSNLKKSILVLIDGNQYFLGIQVTTIKDVISEDSMIKSYYLYSKLRAYILLVKLKIWSTKTEPKIQIKVTNHKDMASGLNDEATVNDRDAKECNF